MPLSQPDITPIPYRDGEGYRLDAAYSYHWKGPDGAPRAITIPAGFEYDGASVPRLVWTCSGILPDGLIRAAALVHDFLYRHSGRLPRGCYGMVRDGVWTDLHGSVWKRHEADKLFARIMREAGVSKAKRRAAYLGVRAGGWVSWK